MHRVAGNHPRLPNSKDLDAWSQTSEEVCSCSLRLAALPLTGYFVGLFSSLLEGRRLDYIGALTSVVGLTALVWSIIEARQRGRTNASIPLGFAVAKAAAMFFVIWERRVPQPMVDTTVFHNPRFDVASISVALTYFALFGSAFLLTQYLQFVRGYTAIEAGVRYLPLAGTMMIFTPVSARLVERLGSKAVIVCGMVTCCFGLLLASRLGADSSYTAIVVSLIVFAGGAGAVMAPATESIMGAVPAAEAGIGSAINYANPRSAARADSPSSAASSQPITNVARRCLMTVRIWPVTACVAVETAWMIESRLGPTAEAAFVGSIAARELAVIDLTTEDWARRAELIAGYHDLGLGLVDASVVAIAERLGVTTVATLNRRDFTVVRPAHCAAFRLIP